VYGPTILTDSLSVPRIDDKFGNRWEYHPRSDRHSKVACWGIALDLLNASALLQRHVKESKVVFGVNHEMRDFATGRKKDLDLVLARPADSSTAGGRTLASLVDKYQVVLREDARSRLEQLPDLQECQVGAVLVALEAKACMTAHIKSLPRLYDELNSSHLTVHGASESALAIGFVMVNLSEEFLSPGLNQFEIAGHAPDVSFQPQPRSTERVLQKIAEMPRRTRDGQHGFDGLGVVVVRARNDGSPIELVASLPAPQPGGLFEYGSMITRMANEYDIRFRHI
jgi:hypothetical protein